jgi:hypothetical protein
VLLAYAGGVGFAGWLFVRVLREAERGVAEAMGVPPTDRPGALTGALLERGDIDAILGPLTGGRVGIELLHEPLIALWAGAAAQALLPVVVLFTAAGSVGAQVSNRAIRYLACRTGRAQIGLGKLVGQLLVAGTAAVIGAAVVWVLAMVLMVEQPPVATAWALADRASRALAYTLPWCGIGMAVSMWVPSANAARAVAAVLFLAMNIGAGLLDELVDDSFAGRLADLGLLLLPPDTWSLFWTVGDAPAGVARCVVLGLAFYALGHARFARVDL